MFQPMYSRLDRARSRSIVAVTMAIVLAGALVALCGCQAEQPDSEQSDSEQPVTDSGAKTVEDALAAGGVAADGGSDVQTAFAAYDWDELSDIAKEIEASGSEEAGLDVARSYNLVNDEGKLTGDCKPFTLSDGTDAAVQIAGFFHDDKPDGGKAGITFIMRDALPEKRAMNASGNNDYGWEYADLRALIQDSVESWIPSEIRDNVVAVRKATNNIGITMSSDAVTLTEDSFWLLSKTEVCGSVAYANEVYSSLLEKEGRQYRLFSDNEITDKAPSPLLIKSCESDMCTWWTRSAMPDANTGSGYFVVLMAGATDDFSYFPDNEYGVVLGFCF